MRHQHEMRGGGVSEQVANTEANALSGSAGHPGAFKRYGWIQFASAIPLGILATLASCGPPNGPQAPVAAECRITPLDSRTSNEKSSVVAKFNADLKGGVFEEKTLKEVFQVVADRDQSCSMLLQTVVCLASNGAKDSANHLDQAISVSCGSQRLDYTGYWAVYAVKDSQTKTFEGCIEISRTGKEFSIKRYDPSEENWESAPREVVVIPTANGFDVNAKGRVIALIAEGDDLAGNVDDDKSAWKRMPSQAQCVQLAENAFERSGASQAIPPSTTPGD